jgi:hypothetical protein
VAGGCAHGHLGIIIPQVEYAWATTKYTAKAKHYPDSSTTKTTPRSISTATTADRSNISYDAYQSTQLFTKVNHEVPKPADNVCIGTLHVFLPTFWCLKCDSWSSHHDKLHDEGTRWQAMKNAQLLKQEDYRKQNPHNHYGPQYQHTISSSGNDKNKRHNNSYDRENYQDKRYRNDRGRSPSRDRFKYQMCSPRSPGDNHRNRASFYDDKKKYKKQINETETEKHAPSNTTEKKQGMTRNLTKLKQ